MDGPTVVMRPSWIAAGQWRALPMLALAAFAFANRYWTAGASPPWRWYIPSLLVLGIPMVALGIRRVMVRQIVLSPEGLEIEHRDRSRESIRWQSVEHVDHWSWWLGDEHWALRGPDEVRTRLDTLGLSGQDQAILREEIRRMFGNRITEHPWYSDRR